MVKKSPTNAGRCGFDPRSRKIPHASEQLSQRSTTTKPRSHTTEPTRHKYCSLCAQSLSFNKRSHCNEKPVHRN